MIGGYLRWYSKCFSLFSPKVTLLAAPADIVNRKTIVTFAEYFLPFRIVDLTVEIVQTFVIRPSLGVLEPTERHTQRYTIYEKRDDPTWPTRLQGIVIPGKNEAITFSRQFRLPY